MKISTKITNQERAYLNNLVVSGAGEIPDEAGKVSDKATHKLVVDKGFIVGAMKIMKPLDKQKKK